MTEPSQPIDDTAPGDPFSDSIPGKEQVLRTKWEFWSLDPNKRPWATSFDYSSRFTDSLTNIMDIAIKSCQSAGASIESPSCLGGWERPL